MCQALSDLDFNILSSNLPYSKKLRLYHVFSTCITPILLYSSFLWYIYTQISLEYKKQFSDKYSIIMDDVLQASIEDPAIINPGTIPPSTSRH